MNFPDQGHLGDGIDLLIGMDFYWMFMTGKVQQLHEFRNLVTVFPLISAGPQISASILISVAPLNAELIRIVTVEQNAYGINCKQ